MFFEISYFFGFSRWRAIGHHVKFLKGQNLIWRGGLEDRGTSPCEMFVKIGPSIGEILRFFSCSEWLLPPSWNLEFMKFYYVTGPIGPKHIIVPNLVKIGKTLAELLWFFEFSRWSPPPSWIFEMAKFYWLNMPVASLPNFFKIRPPIAEIFDFSNF